MTGPRSTPDASRGSLAVEKIGPVWYLSAESRSGRDVLTPAIRRDLELILEEAGDDAGVKVVTIRLNGLPYSEASKASGANTQPPSPVTPALDPVWYFPKPIVAAVDGLIGPYTFDFLGYVDFIVSSEGTRFSMEHPRPADLSLGGTPLVMHFRLKAWKKLMLMGGWLDAERAREYGLVQSVVPEADLDNELRRWVERLCVGPDGALQDLKMAIHRQYEVMGLVRMAFIGDRVAEGGHGTPEDMAWFAAVRQGGLRAALKARGQIFDPEMGRL